MEEFVYKQMICLTPINIKNPKYARRNPHEEMYIQVPCSRCTACLKRRAGQWVFRLRQEERQCHSAYFMTYTYNDENLPWSENGFATLDKRHHTLYMKRLRKQISKKFPNNKTLKYYTVGEYGSQTHRPHYHSILFNLPPFYEVNPHHIENLWGLGNIQIDSCTPGSMAYVCGYVNKQKFHSNFGEEDDRIPEFNFMSQGLGINYLTEEKIRHMKNTLNPYLVGEDGAKISMPKYYKNKVFTEEERLYLAEAAKEYIENNPTFADDTAKRNYVTYQAYKRKLEAIQNRRKL